jgi:tetratricopeptide (TPR) repeat protein
VPRRAPPCPRTAGADRAAEALPLLETARRLDPHASETHFVEFNLAYACWALGRFEEALRWAESALAHGPGGTNAGIFRVLAASQAELGRMHEARATVGRLLGVTPDLRLSTLADTVPAQRVLPRMIEGLRKAGVPE